MRYVCKVALFTVAISFSSISLACLRNILHPFEEYSKNVEAIFIAIVVNKRLLPEEKTNCEFLLWEAKLEVRKVFKGSPCHLYTLSSKSSLMKLVQKLFAYQPIL